MIQHGKKLTKNRDPKLKHIFTKIKQIFRGSRRAERAGVLDAGLSSGARSAPAQTGIRLPGGSNPTTSKQENASP